jgi:5-methylcytosine-specific restriction endonuclease McrA
MNSLKKGRTLEEIYGNEKAADLRALHSSKVGEKNHNWRGGKDRSGYPWTYYQVRLSVIERDGDVCLHCGTTGAEARAEDTLGRGLTVHHIDHNKNNNSLTNLITFCRRCNSAANGKSKDWETVCLKLLGV